MIGEGSEIIPQGSTQDSVEMATLFKFYVLIDPRDNKIKYVGRTVDPENRYRNHIYDAKRNNRNKRERWIISLLRQNIRPIMKIVYELYCTLDEAISTEKMLIKKLGRRFELKNGDDHCLGTIFTGKVVHQFTIDGIFVRTFVNANQAFIATGIKDCNITLVCRGNRKSAGGFIWSYSKEIPKAYSKDVFVKPVYQFDLNKNLLNSYISARAAEKATGISYKKISSVANGRQKSTRDFIWSFNNKI